MSFEQNVEAIAKDPIKRDVVRAMLKEADVGSALMRALGGGALGGLAGGGIGAMAAHSRGESPMQGGMRGAMGGAGLGAGLGGLSAMASPTAMKGLGDKLFPTGAAALMGGAGAAFGGSLMQGLSGDPKVNEGKGKELGKLLAQQEMKSQSQLQLAPRQEQAFQQAMRDDMISRADPEMIQSAFETMKRFAPNLAADPNAVRSFLRETATWGTGPSYATLKNLADAERAVASAGGAL